MLPFAMSEVKGERKRKNSEGFPHPQLNSLAQKCHISLLLITHWPELIT